MKHLIHIILAFVLGVGAGAYWGRNTVQTKAIEAATAVYEKGLDSVVASGSNIIKNQFEGQVNQLKKEGQEYIRAELKKQIDGLFN